MIDPEISPRTRVSSDELRRMFGANLRKLAKSYSSVSRLCRDLGINRTQFNRYLGGESFPRPDVLNRICTFFEIDARILLEPLENIPPAHSILEHPFISNHIGAGVRNLSQEMLPDGFFKFTRRSFAEPLMMTTGLIYVFRIDGATFMRGYESKAAMQRQGLTPKAAAREFRGIVLSQSDGVCALASLRNAKATSFHYLSRVASFQNPLWAGYATRAMRETEGTSRAARIVYEHLGQDTHLVLKAARAAGYCTPSDISPHHQKFFQLDRTPS